MDLNEINFFNLLDEQSKNFLYSIAKKRVYKEDAIIFYETEVPKNLFVVASGRVQIYKCSINGEKVVMGEFGKNAFLAEMPTLMQIPYPASATALCDCEILEISLKEILEFIKCHSPLANIFIESLSNKVKQLEEVIRYTIIKDAKTRVATYIFNNYALLGTLTQREIASQLLLTPEGLSRIVKKLKNEKIVEVKNQKLQVVNLELLKSLI